MAPKMSIYESLLRPLLFNFDPEVAHNLALWAIRHGLVSASRFRDPRLSQELFGISFPNPLGLAAGFDKNAVALQHWERLGFGFAEIGTVTAHAQPGNAKPRMFRLPFEYALINRLGFNNVGAEGVAKNLLGVSTGIPIGVNLGKSKVTALDRAPEDYQQSFRLLKDHGAYFVINVSSPNTPGLRELQEKSRLMEILAAIREVDAHKPLFVKVAPDLEMSALDDVVAVAHETRLTGLIATNTTISRESLPPGDYQEGGLSGAPLKAKAQEFMRHLFKSCDKGMVLIGVGGIFTGQDLFERISAGAHLCQIYTGWVYGGPGTAPKILRELVELMEQHGAQSLTELRGSAVRSQ